MNKSCKDCTKCCEGYLTGTIRGHVMGTETEDPHKPKPCFFVEINSGCKIYKSRPVDPCRAYKCHWIINPEVPEHFKPSISKTIVSNKKVNGISYLLLAEAGAPLNREVLEWYHDYCISNKINFAFKIGKEMHLKGSNEFIAAMNKSYNKWLT
jgi:hypothetical protein